jgi:NhaA family Na+:H+ antiporter
MRGLATLGGIGFTVSVFITGLAFTDTHLTNAAKLAILGASTASALAGAALLWRTTRLVIWPLGQLSGRRGETPSG